MSEQTFDAETLRGNRILRIFYVTQVTLTISLLHRLFLSDFTSAVFLLLTMAVQCNVIWLNKRRKYDTAAGLIILSITGLMLLMIWLHEGMRDELILTFPALVCFSILIGSEKLFKYVFAIIALNVIAIAYVNEAGILSHEVSENDFSSATVILTIMICVTYVIGILGTDITKANKALNQYKETLEDKVQDRTIELEKSLAHLTETQNELVEAEKMASLGRLVAGISHEINTPIGIAVTATSHLEENNRTIIQALEGKGLKRSQLMSLLGNNEQSVKLIHTNLERAHDLIGDFKNVSVIQSAQRRKELNLKAHLMGIIDALKPKLLDTQISVHCDCPEDVIVTQDPQAIIQVITNLFMNSLHHGIEKHTKGEINMEVSQEGSTITLIYCDSGKGVTDEVAENIFEPFFTTKRGKGGSGLGMHIVFNLVSYSLMGTISCNNKVEKGIEFIIRFPTNPSSE